MYSSSQTNDLSENFEYLLHTRNSSPKKVQKTHLSFALRTKIKTHFKSLMCFNVFTIFNIYRKNVFNETRMAQALLPHAKITRMQGQVLVLKKFEDLRFTAECAGSLGMT